VRQLSALETGSSTIEALKIEAPIIEAPSREELKTDGETHHCFSVQELCTLRQALELPLVQALRLQPTLVPVVQPVGAR
jgi:hypothetical protein